MNYNYIIGVDVSKLTLDLALLKVNQTVNPVEHLKVENNEKGLAKVSEWLKELNTSDMLFCMESTGIYCYSLLQYIIGKQADVWVENAVQIKMSQGLTRGKNDKIDAKRIAEYAHKNQDKLKLWKPTRVVVDKLKHLTALRERLITTKKRLLVPIGEFKSVGNYEMAKMMEKAMKKSIKAIDSDLEGVEEQIKKIIDDDDHLNKLFGLVTSVAGIGFVTAINLIIQTNEFTTLKDSRKLACYCGVAPFEHSSGTSVRGRNRVSHMANKKLKTNLHMAALTSIRIDFELKSYYERKVQEGKNKMSIINAVRNKLLSRVVAVVKRGTPYQKNIIENCLVVS
jgi:transposase